MCHVLLQHMYIMLKRYAIQYFTGTHCQFLLHKHATWLFFSLISSYTCIKYIMQREKEEKRDGTIIVVVMRLQFDLTMRPGMLMVIGLVSIVAIFTVLIILLFTHIVVLRLVIAIIGTLLLCMVSVFWILEKFYSTKHLHFNSTLQFLKFLHLQVASYVLC